VARHGGGEGVSGGATGAPAFWRVLSEVEGCCRTKVANRYDNRVCGIAGFIGEDQDLIERMTNALRNRGPDGFGVSVREGVSLGSARLAILDPRPEGNQPMWNDDQSVGIVFNGEIFNFKELRTNHGLQCKTNTDTEVILRLYEKEGIDMVKKLRGMFSFGIYDTRSKTLHVARDPSGITPLFYTMIANQFHFASETKALLRAYDQKPPINPTALSLYCRFQYLPRPFTLLPDIKAVEPGSLLIVQGNNVTMKQWNNESYDYGRLSANEFKKEFPGLMQQVVTDHLISDRPLGLFLSGGLDSSICLHHMQQAGHKPIKTFTARFEVEEQSEKFNRDADLARETAKHYGTDHHELTVTATMYRDAYKDCAAALDQPNANVTAVTQYLLAKFAKQQVDVVLTGNGGDELFGGYPRYRIVHLLTMLRAMPAGARAFIARLAGLPPDVLRMEPGDALMERLNNQSIEQWESLVKGTWFDASATSKWVQERYAPLATLPPLAAAMEYNRLSWLTDEALRMTDGTSLGSGLEARVPLLDQRVIQIAHQTRPQDHVSLFQTKRLLRETYQTLSGVEGLPSHLFNVPKSGFFTPLAKWFRRECKSLIDEMLESEHLAPYFDLEAVRKVAAQHHTGEKYSLHTLAMLTQLHCWFETVYKPK